MITDVGNQASTTHTEYEGAFYPKDSVGADGVPAPLPPEVAGLIREIIEADLAANPEARRVWIAEAERLVAERKRGAA